MEIKLSSGSEINCENYKFSACGLLWLQIVWSSSDEISIYLSPPISIPLCGSKVKVKQSTDCSKCEFDDTEVDAEADWRLQTEDWNWGVWTDCMPSKFGGTDGEQS